MSNLCKIGLFQHNPIIKKNAGIYIFKYNKNNKAGKTRHNICERLW